MLKQKEVSPWKNFKAMQRQAADFMAFHCSLIQIKGYLSWFGK